MAAPRLQPIKPADYIPWRRVDDPRLAERVVPVTDLNQVKAGGVVLLGVPDDRGVVVNHGREGARRGPAVFRQCFYRLPLGARRELDAIPLFDIGDLVPEETIEQTHHQLASVVSALHRRDCTVVLIGGGHDLSYGSLTGLKSVQPEAVLVNMDAHLDVREREKNGAIGSGTAFRRLMEEGKVPGEDIYFVGYHSHSSAAAHIEWIQKNHAHLWPWADLSAAGRLKAVSDLAQRWSQAPAVGVSWDLDSLASSPGVSAPATLGWTTEEAIHIAELFGAHSNIRHLELMELNPKVDAMAMTSQLASVLLWHFLAARFWEER